MRENLMVDDVVLMPPNEPVLKGKAAVRTWYDQFAQLCTHPYKSASMRSRKHDR